MDVLQHSLDMAAHVWMHNGLRVLKLIGAVVNQMYLIKCTQQLQGRVFTGISNHFLFSSSSKNASVLVTV